jgi:hypothetical protein
LTLRFRAVLDDGAVLYVNRSVGGPIAMEVL